MRPARVVPDRDATGPDVLVDVAGRRVRSFEEFVAVLANLDGPVTVRFGRGDTVVAATARVGRVGIVSWFIGGDLVGFPFRQRDAVTANTTGGVAIDDRAVDGGESAGLAWALAVIARRGHLAGRRSDRIVITGGLTAAGQVVLVGSVAPKAIAARDANACLFPGPTGEYRRGPSERCTLRVVGVDTIVDARAAVARGC